MHYSTVKPLCSNFRVITVNFSGVRIFRIFTVICSSCFTFQFGIAVAWLTLFDVIILLVLIPIMDRIIYPWIRRKGWNFSMVKRMIIGLVFATLAILVAGFVEHERLRGYWRNTEDFNAPGNCNYTQIQQKIRKLL